MKVEFKRVKTGFKVVFYRPLVEKWSERWSVKWSEKGLSKRQAEIITMIEKNPLISRKELSSILKINPSAVQKHLKRLKEKGLLKRVGPDKGGHWEVLT